MNVVLDEGAFLPERAYPTDAGADLRTPIDVEVPAHGSAVIETGVHVELPPGTVGMLKSKSGLNVKHGITSEGVIEFTPVRLIRCRDCAHYRPNLMFGDDNGWCAENRAFGRLTDPDGFCHRAKPREGE